MSTLGPVFSERSGAEEKATDLLRGICRVLHPPADSFRKITDDVVQHKLSRHIRGILLQFSLEDACQMLLEKQHEDLSALTGEDALDIAPVVMQMVEYVRDLGVDVLLLYYS